MKTGQGSSLQDTRSLNMVVTLKLLGSSALPACSLPVWFAKWLQAMLSTLCANRKLCGTSKNVCCHKLLAVAFTKSA